jgi:hemerythrin superfamily protein
MADVFKMLESDHRQVERLLTQLSKSEEGPEREQLVKRLTDSLSLHMTFEEEAIYPLLVDLDPEAAQEAQNEHRLAREGVGNINELVSEPGFGAAVEMLKGGIEHHVEDEEGDVFPKLREACDQATIEGMAGSLLQMKREAGILAESLEDASKDELVQIARDAGISGVSQMTKDQLREALTAS